ncbi:hypothetical protein, conserved [Plasmodium gonderi]|uniref:DUF4200 domain-containing protein n=1 Tax=Plasmodium gonderi TaxID=77519 RepID=A0A1Y1JE48_PLAGO|nr:hypothetical protein, conserved [Plasmodium gonderi]GAW79938.1 hypothetical protein, conserved [Plasmodium gonderi]
MSEEDFYQKLEEHIKDSKRTIEEREKLIGPEKSGDPNKLDNPQNSPWSYDYCSLMVPSDHSLDKDSASSDNIKKFLNLHEDEEIESIKKKLIEKKNKRGRITPKKTEISSDKGATNNETELHERRRRDDICKNMSKSSILSMGRKGRKGRRNINDLIELEKEIIITRTLMNKKKFRLHDIYKYTTRRENVISNLNLNMIKEGSTFQELLVCKFQRTAELIRKFAEVRARKKKKKNQVQVLNIEMSKLEVEFEKKEEKIKELDKYKDFLNKLASIEEVGVAEEIIASGEEDAGNVKGQKEEVQFSSRMAKYINNFQLLIDNFSLLEEQHLQLIDDTQNAEYELEEYEKKLVDKKKNFLLKNNEMDKKIGQVHDFIKQHNTQIGEYENTIKNNQSHISFLNINNKIDFICTQFNYDVNTNEIMKKLQILENKIYSYISTLTKYTDENSQLVYEYQREREQERRKQMRFEINLDRKGNNKNKQHMGDKIKNKNFGDNQKEKKEKREKRENIYALFEKDLFE